MADTRAGVFRVDLQDSLSPRPASTKSLCAGLDAERDVAALVYQPGEDPDEVLSDFLCDLRIRGHNAAGLLQRRRSCLQDALDPVEYYLIPGGNTDGLRCEQPDGPAKYRSSQLQVLCGKLSQLLERRPDIVVLNRFGSLEVRGLGLIGVLNKAIDQDVPVVIAVPDALFRSWLSAVQGLAVKLRCNRNDLDRWWRSIQPASGEAAASPNFCGHYK
jgi:hypothetical protein